VTAGPIDEALTAESLSACFGLPLAVERQAGRVFVRSARPQDGSLHDELHDRRDPDRDDHAA